MGMHISSAQLSNMARAVDPTESTAADKPRKKLVKNCYTYKENIIFVGSEIHYDSFWWKMMFMACGFALADRQLHFRTADQTTIAYVDNDYTKAEKLPIEQLKEAKGINLVKISSSADVVEYINTRPTFERDGKVGKLLIQDVAFFSHGVPGRIALNFDSSPDVDVDHEQLAKMAKDVFIANGRIYSYACRTGIASWYEAHWTNFNTPFKSDQDANPKDSLAQAMANHFGINVHAFYTRSSYSEVLRVASDSDRISRALKAARAAEEGNIIDIPSEHEALPHPGLADDWNDWGEEKEGTSEYALWRKKGARSMPVSASSPAGLSKGLKLFKPSLKRSANKGAKVPKIDNKK